MAIEAMGIGALDTMHAARILGLASTEEGCSRAAPPLLQIGDLQGMKVPVLRVSDAGLPAKVESPQRNTVGGISVGSDGKPTCLVDDSIGREDISRSADLGCPLVQTVSGYVQLQQQMLQPAGACLWWENGQDVKAKGGCELEPWEDQDAIANASKLFKLPSFVGLDTP
jgi:hypothetical protein